MAEYSVLIADSSEDSGRALAESLDGFCRTEVCCTGEKALALVRRQPWDVLAADLMLPGMDGISFLQMVLAAGQRPAIVAMSRYVSPYILERAGSLGVNCLFEKPCSLGAVTEKVLYLLRTRNCREEGTMHSRVSGCMLELGFSPKLRGYSYLREAVCQAAMDPDRSMVKEIYASVGAAFGVTAGHVEHSARCAIKDAWIHRDPALWSLYFGNTRPTSAAFVQTLAAGLEDPEEELRDRAAGES